MMIRLELSEEIEERLQEKAFCAGLSLEGYLLTLNWQNASASNRIGRPPLSSGGNRSKNPHRTVKSHPDLDEKTDERPGYHQPFAIRKRTM